MSKLISVIIPVYNVKRYLKKCLDSIIYQTYKDLQIIIIDDGSNDGSELICDEYSKKDSRIMVLHQKNSGVSAARNNALDEANGDYISFIDADDYLEPEMYEVMITDITKYEADIAICGVNNIYEDNSYKNKNFSIDSKTRTLNYEEFLRRMINNNISTSIWNKLFSKKLLENIKFNEKRRIGEDFEFLLKLNTDSVIVYDNRKLYNYFIRNSSSTKTLNQKSANDIFEVNSILLTYTKKEYSNLCNISVYRYLIKINTLINNYNLSYEFKNRLLKERDLYEKDFLKNKKISLLKKIKYLIYKWEKK